MACNSNTHSCSPSLSWLGSALDIFGGKLPYEEAPPYVSRDFFNFGYVHICACLHMHRAVLGLRDVNLGGVLGLVDKLGMM